MVCLFKKWLPTYLLWWENSKFQLLIFKKEKYVKFSISSIKVLAGHSEYLISHPSSHILIFLETNWLSKNLPNWSYFWILNSIWNSFDIDWLIVLGLFVRRHCNSKKMYVQKKSWRHNNYNSLAHLDNNNFIAIFKWQKALPFLNIAKPSLHWI